MLEKYSSLTKKNLTSDADSYRRKDDMNGISRFHHFVPACNRLWVRIRVFWETHKGAIVLTLMCIAFVGWLVYCEIKADGSRDYLQAIIMSITAVIALLTLDSMRRSNNAQVMREYDREYASKEMLTALEKVEEFVKKHKEHFQDTRMPDKEPVIKEEDFGLKKEIRAEIDQERRTVKFYFMNILSMYQEGYISYRAMHHLFDKSGFAMFFESIERMENIINRTYDCGPFKKAMSLCYDLYEKYREKNEGLN